MKKVKKFIFPGTTLLVSLYISVLFTFGIIFGYITTLLFHKKIVERGKLKPIFLKIGKWEIHLHHWLMGALAIFVFWVVGWFPYLPKFCLGALGGLVFHDIYSDREWYKIILKK